MLRRFSDICSSSTSEICTKFAEYEAGDTKVREMLGTYTGPRQIMRTCGAAPPSHRAKKQSSTATDNEQNRIPVGLNVSLATIHTLTDVFTNLRALRDMRRDRTGGGEQRER